MTDDPFSRVFGDPARRSFAERVGTPDELFGRQGQALAASPTGQAIVAASDEYRAFGYLPTGNVNLSCELRWWMDGTNIPEGLAFPYRLLMQVGFSGDDTLRILLPDCAVQVTGQRLEPLRQALMRQQVTFVQQWSALVWRGKSAEESVVDRIEVKR